MTARTASRARSTARAGGGALELLECTGEAGLLVDPLTGTILAASSGAGALWHASAAALVGESIDRLLPGLQSCPLWSAPGGQPRPLRVETSAALAEGISVEVEVTLAGVDDPPGARVVVVRDVSVRRDAERAAHAAARLASLGSDVNAALASVGDVSAVLQRVAEALVRHLDAAFARIWTLDEAENVLLLRASAGMYTHLDGPHGRIPVGMYKVGMVAQECRPEVTNQVVGDPRVSDPEWARREGMVSFAGFPLVVDERLVGVLALFARHELTDDALRPLEIAALGTAQYVDRKRAEAELAHRADVLAQTNAELERFAYVASHDLQEPLRIVVSFLQILERRYRDQLDERAHQYIDLAVDGGKRMQRLINDLLVYSRLGRQAWSPAPVVVSELIEQVLAGLRLAIVESDARVEVGALPTVVGDAVQLGQVFQNLLSNALKYRRAERPLVQVASERVGDEWRFMVRDDGIGIAPQHHDRIFEIFQRLHSHDEYPGSGVGLAICRLIVQRHGGRIWVESTPGEGSTFFFTLPRADAARP